MNILVVGNAKSYASWIPGSLTKDPEKADLFLFTGGEDVFPPFYNEPIHYTTFFDISRDIFEIEFFNIAKSLNKHMLGICRGAQLICALSGGKLVQHQENPKFTHETHVYDSEDSIIMTSTHHQAQYPWRLNKDDFKVLAWTHNVSPFHFNGDNQELELPENKECEVVYYKLTKGLGIQGHPEIVQDFQSHPMIKWCLKTLRLFMKDEL